MSELDTLERDVEQSRARFADDLARLTSPGRLSAVKQELWSDADRAKNTLVEKARDAAKDGAQSILTDLKQRAIANPAAALAIGAGLAWRIARHPPIASILVGVGLFSLLRTSPAPNGKAPASLEDHEAWARRNESDSLAEKASGVVETAKDKASALAESAKDTVEGWTAQAGAAARSAVRQVGDAARLTTDRVSDAAGETVTQISEGVKSAAERASHVAADTATRVSEKISSMGHQASAALHEALPDAETRDRYLLAVAGLAVAAAVGIAVQRRVQENA